MTRRSPTVSHLLLECFVQALPLRVADKGFFQLAILARRPYFSIFTGGGGILPSGRELQNVKGEDSNGAREEGSEKRLVFPDLQWAWKDERCMGILVFGSGVAKEKRVEEK